MERFVCEKCNYRFEAKKARSCPYCGNGSIEKEKSASELISEVADILEE